MILTKEYGSVAIEDVADQDVHLLDGNGDWVLCHIYDHGVQETQLTYFQGDNQRIGIWSTAEHGWVSNGEIVKTKDFAGHNTEIDDLRPSKRVQNEESYRKGIAHGLVYGDGYLSYLTVDGGMNFGIRLCAEKVELAEWFKGHDVTYPLSANGDPVYSIKQAWCNLKALPEQPGDDLDYLLGFLRGWFGTDGCVSKVPTPTLCGDELEYDWLKKWGPLVSWHVNGFCKLNEVTNYGKRNKQSLNFHIRKSSMDCDDFIRDKHRERWLLRPVTRKATVKGKYDWNTITEWLADGMTSQEVADKLEVKATAFRSSYSQHKKAMKERDNFERKWYVYGSKDQTWDRRFERVYCPVVPTTHTYALSCGIHQANCFTRILNLEKRHQSTRDDLLIMSGVNPSFTRQVDNDMEQRDGFDVKADTAVKKIPAKRGRKPRAKV